MSCPEVMTQTGLVRGLEQNGVFKFRGIPLKQGWFAGLNKTEFSNSAAFLIANRQPAKVVLSRQNPRSPGREC